MTVFGVAAAASSSKLSASDSLSKEPLVGAVAGLLCRSSWLSATCASVSIAFLSLVAQPIHINFIYQEGVAPRCMTASGKSR